MSAILPSDQRAILERFFDADVWRASTDRFPLSGYALVDRVNALLPRVVVDVGCGFNPFKGRIRNLIGIDLVNAHADLVCSLEDAPFAEGSVDVALALGSINFGGDELVRAQIGVVGRWLRAGGHLFMRVNPGEPVGGGVPIFPWTIDLAHHIGAVNGLVIVGEVREERLVLSNGTPARRLFWVYKR